MLREIIQDINSVLTSYTEVQTSQVLNSVLHRIVRYTNSEFGFIGRLDTKTDKIHTITCSNSAWDVSSFFFYTQHFNQSFFHKKDKFLRGEGRCDIKSPSSVDECVIVNKMNYSKIKFPDGHPVIQRYMAIPSTKKDNHQVVIVVCNSSYKYSIDMIDKCSPVADVLSYLFIRLEI